MANQNLEIRGTWRYKPPSHAGPPSAGQKIAGDAFLHPRPIPAAILRQEYSGPDTLQRPGPCQLVLFIFAHTCHCTEYSRGKVGGE